MRYDPVVTVCNRCLRACCWQGQLMCEQSGSAGTQQRAVSSLIGPVTLRSVVVSEALEHPDWWNQQLREAHQRLLTVADLRALGITEDNLLALTISDDSADRWSDT